MDLNNEVIGISAEIAIADVFNVHIDDNYRKRGNKIIVDSLKPSVKKAFNDYNLPKPENHIAGDQNPIDFILQDGKTLSVKTNKKSIGKVAPQKIGQPTSETYFKYFKDIFEINIPTDLNQKRHLFKEISINKIDIVMKEYWNNMFECDYLVHFFNIIEKPGCINPNPSFIVLSKFNTTPNWQKKNLNSPKH